LLIYALIRSSLWTPINANAQQVGNANSKNAALGSLVGATIMGNPWGIFGGG